MKRRSAFSLIETLVTLAAGIIVGASLAAVLTGARTRPSTDLHTGEQAMTCESNLQHLWLAVQQYAKDHDDSLPYAVDPSDKAFPINYSNLPEFQAKLAALPTVMEVLAPYTHDARLWRCPQDSGFDIYDATGQPWNGRPTCYTAFGTSYLYRTELTYNSGRPGVLSPRSLSTIGNPSAIEVFFDAWAWHAQSDVPENPRYNVLFADGHITTVDRAELVVIQHRPL